MTFQPKGEALLPRFLKIFWHFEALQRFSDQRSQRFNGSIRLQIRISIDVIALLVTTRAVQEHCLMFLSWIIKNNQLTKRKILVSLSFGNAEALG